MKKRNTSKDPFVPTYNRSGAAMVKGRGAYLVDAKGKRYLDFGSGIAVTALGHGHSAIVSALRKQGSALLHASNLYMMAPQLDLAKLLVKHTFGDRVFFCNSGTEAMEAAIKFARKWATRTDPKKYHVLSFTDGFHGRTYGALSATAQPKFHAGFKPIVPGFHYTPFNDIEKTRAMLDKHAFAAILVEPLQGEGGINPASRKFLRFLRSYATKHKIALVFDEIQCGMGRTGTLWNYEQHGVVPDIMALAKPLGGGLPLGAIVCKERIAATIKPGDHGTTFGGNPLACALGCVVLGMVAKKSFLRDVQTQGKRLKAALEKIAASSELVDEVRGSGLMLGARMHRDPAPVIGECRRKGLLVIKAAHNTVRFMPPLTVKNSEIDKAVRIFDSVLKKAGNARRASKKGTKG
jgi:predicted acetylornithine/succinylornithine family transaminase